MTDKLRRLLAEATPGPWTHRLNHKPYRIIVFGGTKAYAAGLTTSDIEAADARLIVAAVNALPALLDVVEAAADLYSIAVGEHGHDEPHSPDWPSCPPAHIAMNRYRAALHRLGEPA